MDELTAVRLKINQVDNELAKLFEKRMELVEEVVKYKKAHHMDIFDNKREQEVIINNSKLVNEAVREYYVKVLQCMMDVSKEYQKEIMEEE